MMRAKKPLRWAGILVVCAAFCYVGIEARSAQEPVKAPETGRPDLINIDTLAAFEPLELPAVTFAHDRHTEALQKEQKNCQTCHFVEDHKLSLAFKRLKSTKPGEIKDIYHSNCIGCHMDMAAAGKKTGPPEGLCRSCHDAKPKIASTRLEFGLDKVLHFRHVDSKIIRAGSGEKDNCGQCHHVYDEQAKKTIYVKGKEDSCRDCHLDKPQKDVRSWEKAAHQQCVLCHWDLAARGVKEKGPYDCAGCHSSQGQALVAKKNQAVVAKLPDNSPPRLMRGQPDAALITYEAKGNDKGAKPLLMNPVAFDHKAHEQYTNSCRVCHHAGMESCNTCHTLGGSDKGKLVTFEQAMHQKTSQHSCIGCHAVKQTEPVCAGCHKQIQKSSRPDDASCKQCHMQLPEGQAKLIASLTSSQKSGIAEMMLKNRNMNVGTYPMGEIPDKVTIGDLSDKYEPNELNHRKHVDALMQGMKDNSLARYFHRDPGTMCQGCHHQSPPSKQPPRCISCHGKIFQAKEKNRPELLAAMHIQCMACHEDMKITAPASTACSECHKEKKK